MKYSRVILSLTIMCLLLGAAACGSGEPIIETAAADMNFSAADLGSGWSMQEELAMDEMLAEVPDHALDANQRTFVSEEVLGKVMVSQMFSTKSVASAKREMKGDLVQTMTTAFEQQASGGSMVEMASPDLGDEAIMLGGEGTVSGVGMRSYVVALRKANVFAMVFLMGPTESATKKAAMDYAQKLEARIQ